MKLETQRRICLLVAVASILTIVGTVSYAYFTAAGTVKNQTAELITGTMRVRFMDNDSGINKKINIGETVTKKFTITNTGTLESSINLNWLDLVNTYTWGSLTYTLSMSQTENGTYDEIISKTNIPTSSVSKKIPLAKNIILPVGATYYYNLSITFNHLDNVNQNNDLEANFSTRFEAVDANDNTSVLSTESMEIAFTDNMEIEETLDRGETINREFSISNRSSEDLAINLNWDNLINTYSEDSITYSLSQGETANGTSNKLITSQAVPSTNNAETIVLAKNIKVPTNKTYYYNLEIARDNSDTSSEENAVLNTSFAIKDLNAGSPTERIIAASNGVRTNFDDPALTDEGVFEMEDDYGTSYYFRGAVEDNYVKYGVNAQGHEMWWRIIRINGDGSVRMVYDGTQGYANGTANNDRFIKTSQPYNVNKNDNKYVGWMYGPEGTTASTSKEQAQTNIADSDAKKVVDAWYKENIEDTGYGANVSDAIFCNDRSTPGKAETGYSSDTGLGYGANATAYGSYSRMKMGVSGYTGVEPSFICPQKNDAFTVNDISKGNGSLTYPVGLITADEIVLAGSGKYHISEGNSKYYLYKSSSYYQWSLSPAFSFSNGAAIIFGVGASGHLGRDYVTYANSAVAPVINLTPKYANSMIGTGTITNPYRAPGVTV